MPGPSSHHTSTGECRRLTAEGVERANEALASSSSSIVASRRRPVTSGRGKASLATPSSLGSLSLDASGENALQRFDRKRRSDSRRADGQAPVGVVQILLGLAPEVEARPPAAVASDRRLASRKIDDQVVEEHRRPGALRRDEARLALWEVHISVEPGDQRLGRLANVRLDHLDGGDDPDLGRASPASMVVRVVIARPSLLGRTQPGRDASAATARRTRFMVADCPAFRCGPGFRSRWRKAPVAVVPRYDSMNPVERRLPGGRGTTRPRSIAMTGRERGESGTLLPTTAPSMNSRPGAAAGQRFPLLCSIPTTARQRSTGGGARDVRDLAIA